MDWLPLLSTLAGAAIGIVATLIADRNRRKHEDAKEARRLRLDIYTQYTTTVKVLGETLRALAEREHPSDDERALTLREAFRDPHGYLRSRTVRFEPVSNRVWPNP